MHYLLCKILDEYLQGYLWPRHQVPEFGLSPPDWPSILYVINVNLWKKFILLPLLNILKLGGSTSLYKKSLIFTIKKL